MNPSDDVLKKRIKSDLGSRMRFKGRSEGGQDRWVLEVLKDKKGGFFVDCGAAHPSIINNTWQLEKKYEWKGICIEPNIFFFEELEKERDCLCLNMAVSNEKGHLDFRLASFGSSLLKNKDMFNKILSHQIVKISCDTLEHILDEHNAPKVIHYLDLDIPGAELDVVSSFNFDKYKIQCLTIKRNDNNIKEVQKVLEANGFERRKDLYIDMAYINLENIKRETFGGWG